MYSVAVAALSDATEEGGGIRMIDFQSYLDGKGYAHEPLKNRVTLEDLWHSDFIAIGDAGVILVAGEGDGIANPRLRLPRRKDARCGSCACVATLRFRRSHRCLFPQDDGYSRYCACDREGKRRKHRCLSEKI